MAQRVGYFQDFHSPEEAAEAFKEGPFVVVDAWGYRIEVEKPGYHCPVFPHPSISVLREKELGWPPGKTTDLAFAESVCDGLNQMVKDGRIVLDTEGKFWRAAE